MGRIFEKRKHKMFARYDKMAKTFTRIGKEIAIAVKKGGPDADTNPMLRRIIQNLIEDPLAEGLLDSRFHANSTILVEVEDDLLKLSPTPVEELAIVG